MDRDRALRDHLDALLAGGRAHLDFDSAVADLPEGLRGRCPSGVPHSPWRLVEHLRITQADILGYCLDRNHVSPQFPDGYWPEGDAPPAPGAWDRTLEGFRDDLAAFRRLVADPTTDLLAPLPNGSGHTVLREALILADHNAYHLGQFVVVRRALGAWDDA